MNNFFKEIPWSTIRVLGYIVHEYNRDNFVDAIAIRKHFKFKVLREQRHLEALLKRGYIDNVGTFYNKPGIFNFRVTAKALTSFESLGEMLLIFLISSFLIPAVVAVVATLITNALIGK